MGGKAVVVDGDLITPRRLMDLPLATNRMMTMINGPERINCGKMVVPVSRSTLFLKTFCVSLVLASMVIIPGCITTPSGPGGTLPVTSLPSTTVSPVPVPSLTPEQSAATLQLIGNIYALSSNPQVGIDTIMFTISPASRAQAVDLTRLEIVFFTPGTTPVVITRGTTEATSTFTATNGNNAVTSLSPGNEVEISFRVKGVPAATRVNIELRPSGGAVLPISRTVPAMVYSMNVLN